MAAWPTCSVRRWSAAFATSPVAEGGPPAGRPPGWPPGWPSTRPAPRPSPGGRGRLGRLRPRRQRAARAARRRDACRCASDCPFSAWISDGHALGRPTVDDLDYHLTTLFPPVRPGGWLELRYLDALPDPWWRVAAAVVTALAARPRRPASRRGGGVRAGGRSLVRRRPLRPRRSRVPRRRHGQPWPPPATPSAASPCPSATATAAFVRPLRRAATSAGAATPGDDVLDAWRRGRPLVALPPEDDRWT